ncbi:MAG: SRPBCC family protein [Polyangiaceae bacterium]|nr:SRPBCC family protein [Polyangiaceae bacterium]
MPIFEKRTRIEAPPDEVFAFHELPDALERLTPPFESVRVLEKTRGIKTGARVVLLTKIGPINARWVAEHTAYEQGRMFKDRQVKGPFAKWEHTHLFEPDGEGGTWLIDRVEYELPLGALGRLFGGGFARRKLERMFEFRHRVTKEACERRA